MKNFKFQAGDIWGGLASSLVALPSAIAFGLVIFAPLGIQAAGTGAVCGIIGTIAVGLIAPIFGGAPRLISAPCAPAAAVLTGLVLEMVRIVPSITFQQSLLVMSVVALATGLLQILFGVLGGGKLIKYIPYPVVAGYLSGVGIIILTGQVSKVLGLKSGTSVLHSLTQPSDWNLNSVVIGFLSIIAMIFAQRMTKKIPAPIIALTVAISSYFILAMFDSNLFSLEKNPLIVGPLNTSSIVIPAQIISQNLNILDFVKGNFWPFIIFPSLMLSMLLSIDTLKTCVVLDALTKSRHDSNRELLAQGLGNTFCSLLGGVPGAGTMGATLVSLTSGGMTKFSGIAEGLASLIIFLFIGKLIAWIPLAALGGILTVVGFRMVDPHIFDLAKNKSTVLDFFVVVSVVLTAVTFNLMAAAGVGVALAILLFLREQIRGSVIRRQALGNTLFSKKKRLSDEISILEKYGDRAAIFELQGSLFFGTTDQLLTELDKHLNIREFIVLDMKRVTSLDFTGAHLLDQVESRLGLKNAKLVFANIPKNLPSGQDLYSYLDHLGLITSKRRIVVFEDLDAALEWIEDEIIKEVTSQNSEVQNSLDISEIDLFKGASAEAIQQMSPSLKVMSFPANSKVFKQGELGDEIYFIRKGNVRIQLALSDGKYKHLTTFGRGDFFGDMAFLDNHTRSAEALATTDTELYALSREAFEEVNKAHPKTGSFFFLRLSQILASRLRLADIEIGTLEEN